MSDVQDILDPRTIDTIVEYVKKRVNILDKKDLLFEIRKLVSGASLELVRAAVEAISMSLLINHPIFGAMEFATEAANYVFNYIDIEVFVDGKGIRVRASINDRYWDDIKKDFSGWKGAIVQFRESINAQTLEKYAIRNSYYMRKLYGEHGVSLFTPRLEFQEREGQFIYLLEYGNVGVDWSGVEYGGISLVDYQGIRFAESVVEFIDPIIKRLVEDVELATFVVDKTKFFEEVEELVSEEFASIIEEAVTEFLNTGKVDKGKYFVRFRDKYYEIYVTKAGRLGLRYYLKMSLSGGTREP